MIGLNSVSITLFKNVELLWLFSDRIMSLLQYHQVTELRESAKSILTSTLKARKYSQLE